MLVYTPGTPVLQLVKGLGNEEQEVYTRCRPFLHVPLLQKSSVVDLRALTVSFKNNSSPAGSPRPAKTAHLLSDLFTFIFLHDLFAYFRNRSSFYRQTIVQRHHSAVQCSRVRRGNGKVSSHLQNMQVAAS